MMNIKNEKQRKMDSVQAFGELAEFFQTLPNPWENEEALYAEMSEDCRRKRMI